MYKSNVNCKVLKEQLEFLMKNNLVEEKILRKEKVVYGITSKGMQVLKYFREIEQVFPMKEEVRHHPLLY
jgi:predicted transcriptional regulator